MTGELLDSVSVVIVNYDRVETTIKCVEHVEKSTGGRVLEIIVVDNGSSAEVVSALTDALEGRARLIPLGTNRYFGEGNNIGVEEATGDLILLLNNDAYVEPSCIEELVRSMREDPQIAGIAPMFLYPDGRVQEVGGIVLETGDVVQVGKGAIWGPDHYKQQFTVDYCSAACFMMRRCDFLELGGFALQWEPAYYEDVDLCLMLWDQVGPVMVNPLARVVHLESLTTSDARMRLESQVEINRLTFIDKWGGWLKQKRAYRPTVEPHAAAQVDVGQLGLDEGPPNIVVSAWHRSLKSAALYTPYALIPGGGERVLFELGAVLEDALGEGSVSVATPHRYSGMRMRQLSKAFGLTGPSRPTTYSDLLGDPPDVGVVLGNEVAPPVAGFGRRLNVYLCQFPFDAPEDYIRKNIGHIASFDEIWVYSDFVRRYINGHLRLLGVRAPNIRVVYPPATVPGTAQLTAWTDRRSVMTVGRFFKGGHNKRQDVVIDIVRQLSERLGRSVPLVIVGSLHPTPESRDRFRELVELSGGLDCTFYPNASRETLIELYSRSAVLVHATGFGVDKYSFPERLEHFGIAPVEAACLGCIPVVYDEGGPAEVMRLLECPTTFHSIPEAVEKVAGILSDVTGSQLLSEDLISRSDAFSRQAFQARVTDALAEVLQG